LYKYIYYRGYWIVAKVIIETVVETAVAAIDDGTVPQTLIKRAILE